MATRRIALKGQLLQSSNHSLGFVSFALSAKLTGWGSGVKRQYLMALCLPMLIASYHN